MMLLVIIIQKIFAINILEQIFHGAYIKWFFYINKVMLLAELKF